MGPPAEEMLERSTIRKVTLRLIPFLCLLYFVNILDRVNIGFARLHRMLGDLQLSETAYALGAGVFYVGYCALEVPSNLLLSRIGARRWIARILVSWGLLSACMMFVKGPWSFAGLRFLLGCAEAGFFPGIVLYLTYWFPARQRARAVGLFMVAAPLVWIVGGPLSGGLVQYLDNLAGLAGWQWMFLLEGVPVVLLGGLTLCYLTDRPEQANWLTPDERAWLVGRLAREEEKQAHNAQFGEAVRDWRVWHLVALASSIALGISGLSYYFPRLIKDRFPTLTPVQVGLLAALSGAATLLSLVAVSRHSDRTGERRWHVAGPAFVAAVGWALSAWHQKPLLSFVGLVLAQAAMLSMWGPFWSLPTAFLGGRAGRRDCPHQRGRQPGRLPRPGRHGVVSFRRRRPQRRRAAGDGPRSHPERNAGAVCPGSARCSSLPRLLTLRAPLLIRLPRELFLLFRGPAMRPFFGPAAVLLAALLCARAAQAQQWPPPSPCDSTSWQQPPCVCPPSCEPAPPRRSFADGEPLFAIELLLGQVSGVRGQVAGYRDSREALVVEGFYGELFHDLGSSTALGAGGRWLFFPWSDDFGRPIFGPGVDVFFGLNHKNLILLTPSLDLGWMFNLGGGLYWELGLEAGLGIGMSGHTRNGNSALGKITPLISVYTGLRF
jgi:MFS family permease